MTDETEDTAPGDTRATAERNRMARRGRGRPAKRTRIGHQCAIHQGSFLRGAGDTEIFKELQNKQPNISVHVDVKAKNIAPPAYEVILSIKAECKIDDAAAFIMELSYGGVFTINVPEQHLRPVLLIECPRLLFPFARQIVAMTTVNGGFLPLMLGPVDFAGLYQRQAQEAQAETPPPEDNDAKLV